MAGSILGYINEHTWAQWAFALAVFAPPLLITLARGERGLASLVIGWFAFLLILALILI